MALPVQGSLFPPAQVLVPCFYGQTGEGWTGPHHCEACAAAVERACQAFDEAVARGIYDANGYTPSEAKAARKRGTYRAWRTAGIEPE